MKTVDDDLPALEVVEEDLPAKAGAMFKDQWARSAITANHMQMLSIQASVKNLHEHIEGVKAYLREGWSSTLEAMFAENHRRVIDDVNKVLGEHGVGASEELIGVIEAEMKEVKATAEAAMEAATKASVDNEALQRRLRTVFGGLS